MVFGGEEEPRPGGSSAKNWWVFERDGNRGMNASAVWGQPARRIRGGPVPPVIARMPWRRWVVFQGMVMMMDGV